MDSLNFETEMEADGQGSYSLFPALDSMSSLTGAAESLDAWVCWAEDENLIHETPSSFRHRHKESRFILLRGNTP